MGRKILTDTCPHCGMLVTFIIETNDDLIIDPRVQALVDEYLKKKKKQEEEKKG